MAGVLAITQPGDLGGEDTAAPVVTTTTSTTSTTVATDVTTTTTPSTTSTTVGGSGLGNPNQPTGGSDGTADTGMESMLAPGLGLLGLGMLLRRSLRPSPR